jgi:hypothetical protein
MPGDENTIVFGSRSGPIISVCISTVLGYGSGANLNHAMNMRRLLLISIAVTLCGSPSGAASADGKLRIICFGAHPDDCELQAGGVAAMWAAKGHKVKLVSVTNGDIGHWREAGGPLALRRAEEVRKADKILGVTSQVLDIHEGE